MEDFVVEDIDHDYPTDHTLMITEGANYTVVDNIITPDADFTGALSVSIVISDGIEDSEVFLFDINVDPLEAANVVPVITGLVEPLQTNANASITLSLEDLLVEDTNHSYPTEHTLTILNGDNYSVDGTTITPEAGYVGALSVEVTVSDGVDDSESFVVEIEVVEVLSADVRKEKYSIYPNPTYDGTIHVIGVPLRTIYQLRDISGRLLQSDFINNEQMVIEQPTGTYLLEVIISDQERIQRMVIKR